MRHFLNNVEITPKNRTQIGVVSDFTGNPQILNLSVDSVILPREAFNQIQSHITNVGLFEGIPYRIEFDGNINLEYYVDLIDGVKVRLHEIEVKLKRRKGFDDFKDKADATSFSIMAKNGQFFSSFQTPYVIIPTTQNQDIIPLLVTTYILTLNTIEAYNQLQNSITELIQATTPSVGVGVVMDTGDIIALALKVVARLIIFGLLVDAMSDLASQIMNYVLPRKRNLNAIKIQNLMTSGCEYFGYTFQSTLLNANPNYAVLPVPLVRERKSIFATKPNDLGDAFNYPYPSTSDTTPTLGQFIDAIETMFNAKIKVIENVVHFERWDYWIDLINTQMFPALNLQSDGDEVYSYNTEDCWKRYYMKYQLDFADQHTLDSVTYDRHDAEFSTEPTSFINEDLISIKNVNQVDIPFSLGARKGSLNWFEKYVKETMDFIDGVSALFGGSTNYGQQIASRTDCLKISQMYFGVTKMLYVNSGGRQPIGYLNYVSAKSLWDKFHYINAVDLNAWIIKENARIKLSNEDFVTLQNNNYAYIGGEVSEILKIKYIDETAFAEITYRTKSNYALGKVITEIINE